MMRAIWITCFWIVLGACAPSLESPMVEAVAPSYTIKQVQESVEAAAQERGWLVKKIKGEDAYSATLDTRGHTVKVKIVYDKESIAVHYVDSTNMDYDGTHIHKKYGKWVQLLFKSFRKELASK
ncbi:MAG: hypothetical protein AB7T49_17330 [Oligoflexales bacterium]